MKSSTNVYNVLYERAKKKKTSNDNIIYNVIVSVYLTDVRRRPVKKKKHTVNSYNRVIVQRVPVLYFYRRISRAN